MCFDCCLLLVPWLGPWEHRHALWLALVQGLGGLNDDGPHAQQRHSHHALRADRAGEDCKAQGDKGAGASRQADGAGVSSSSAAACTAVLQLTWCATMSARLSADVPENLQVQLGTT